MNEVVFLLGAGASVDAGLHTATQLTAVAEEDVAANFPQLVPVVRYIDGAIRFGRGSRGEDPKPAINIEDFLTACTLLANRSMSPYYPFVSSWHEKIGELQVLPEEVISESPTDSFRFLADYCKRKLREWLAISDPTRVKYMRSFLDFINAPYRLRIFTLNYDECIELALRDLTGSVGNSWTSGFDENGWNPSLLSDDYSAYLYKLHGSLDWVDDEKLGICSVKWPQARDAEELPDDYESLLIFGTDVKMRPVDPFLTLLSHFQRCLNANDLLAIIGYSFGDEHINTMIKDSLQRNPKKQCLIVDVRPNLQEILPADWQQHIAKERFELLCCPSRDAFDENHLLSAVKRAVQSQEEAAPF